MVYKIYIKKKRNVLFNSTHVIIIIIITATL